MTSVLDGGYYAIKGFNFQYDYSLITILETPDQDHLVEIELVEDLGDSNSYVQVKYKERTNYSPSTIKKPVLQLMELYKKDKRNPILYAHFNNKQEEEWQPNKNELLNIIGNCTIKSKVYVFEDALIEEFINNFKIIFTSKYQDQFEKLIDVIKENFKCEEDIALIYYAQMYKYLEKKVIDAPPNDKRNRICTKKELLSLIQSSSKQLFYFNYSNFLGKKRYYNLIHKLYFRQFNKENRERIFLFECNEGTTTQVLFELTRKIIDKFYSVKRINGRNIVISPAPYIMFYNSNTECLKELKKQLTLSEILLKDGFNYEHSDFDVDSLVKHDVQSNIVKVKFLNNINYLEDIIPILNSANLSIFNFYLSNDVSIENKKNDLYSYSKFQIEDLKDLIELLF